MYPVSLSSAAGVSEVMSLHTYTSRYLCLGFHTLSKGLLLFSLCLRGSILFEGKTEKTG